MLDFLFYAAALIVTLGILVTFHEWGHFYAARKLGVKVLRFSVGFGKPLWKRVGKDGVEYVIAGIPLGGYVKMLDEREGDVAEADKSMAFNRQALWKRNVIIAAGPFANFVLAILVYWLVFVTGVVSARPVLGSLDETKIAAQSGLIKGDEIVAVDGVEVTDWQDTVFALAKRMGDGLDIQIDILREGSTVQRSVTLKTHDWVLDERRPDIMDSLGLEPAQPKMVLEVVPGGAAEKAGFVSGDEVLSINQESELSWTRLTELVAGSKGETLSFVVLRDTQRIELSVSPEKQSDGYKIGVGLNRKTQLDFYDRIAVVKKYGVFEAVGPAFDKFWDIVKLTATFFKKLILGEVSTKSLGGPLSIAEGAGSSARGGLVIFLGFLGMISVNLGLINLLPVPVLDGGHLLFNTIEAIKGKPLSEAAQEFGMRIGIIMVLGLMAIAIFNDFARL